LMFPTPEVMSHVATDMAQISHARFRVFS
jgi:hypothetical protein